jgi:hypothetical protein
MSEPSDMLRLECERIARGIATVSARRNGEIVHKDELNLNSARARNAFVKALCEKAPVAQAKEIEAELLRFSDMLPTPSAPATETRELDVSHMVRPEQFFTPDVAALTVPVVVSLHGEPKARWVTYLQWSDGRRERWDLDRWLELPRGARLCVHPMPGEPPPNSPPAWRSMARQAWLGGASGPNPADVFQALCKQISYFIDLPDNVAAGTVASLALWCLLTYVYQAWSAVPYLHVGGPLASGKSRVFEVLAQLVFRPLATANLTAPVLFRTLNDQGGTLLFDEAERLKRSTPDQQEILGLLLAGYRRGGKATRLEAVGDTFRPMAFDVYGPKALACISGLPPALASRCIPVTMFRAGPDSPKSRRRIDSNPEQLQRLRDDLHALALERGATWLELARRTDVCPAGVDGRSFELWQPLLALAAWVQEHGAQGLLQLMQQFALATVETGKEDQIPEADEVLLEIMIEQVTCGNQPTPGEILLGAKHRAPATFDKWIPRMVSGRLKAYGIGTPKKSHGERRYRNVSMDTLLRIQKHYSIDLGIADPRPDPSSPLDPRAAVFARSRVALGGHGGRCQEPVRPAERPMSKNMFLS